MSLTALDMCACAAQDISSLEACTRLVWLNLAQCENVVDSGPLEACTWLDCLSLEKCRSLEDIDALAECKQLESLNLGACRRLEDIDALATCHQLTSLGLCHMRYEDEYIELTALESCPLLTELDLLHLDFTATPASVPAQGTSSGFLSMRCRPQQSGSVHCFDRFVNSRLTD